MHYMGRNQPTPAQHQATKGNRMVQYPGCLPFFIQSMYLALLNTHQGKENGNRGGSAVVSAVSVEPKVASSNPSLRHFSNFLPF